MNANDAVERLRDYAALKIGTLAPSEARAILAAFDTLTAELAAAKGERAQIVAYTLEQADCWAKEGNNPQAAFAIRDCMKGVASGAHLTSEGEPK